MLVGVSVVKSGKKVVSKINCKGVRDDEDEGIVEEHEVKQDGKASLEMDSEDATGETGSA